MNIQDLSDGCCRSAGRPLFREHALKDCNDSWSSATGNASMAAIDDPSERPAIVPAAVLAQLSKRHAPAQAAHRQMRADARSAEGHRFESPPLHQEVPASSDLFDAPPQSPLTRAGSGGDPAQNRARVSTKSETVSDFSALDYSDGHGIMRLEWCGRRRRPRPRVVGSAIPKPSTWVGLLVGFSALGFAGYSRARSRQR